jgi:hypothetical protein
VRFGPCDDQLIAGLLDYGYQTIGLLVIETAAGIVAASLKGVQATFFQKVILCAIAGFLAAALIQWGKVFIEGADDALNKGYQHHSLGGLSRNP